MDLLTLARNIAEILGGVISLSVVIFAATAWLKQLGITGVFLTIGAFAVGLIIGIAARYAMAPMVTFADWFWAVLFGLMSGFLATGAYKGAESATGKPKSTVLSTTINNEAVTANWDGVGWQTSDPSSADDSPKQDYRK